MLCACAASQCSIRQDMISEQQAWVSTPCPLMPLCSLQIMLLSFKIHTKQS